MLPRGQGDPRGEGRLRARSPGSREGRVPRCRGHLEQRASPEEAGGANSINPLAPLRPWVPCCGERGNRGRVSPAPASSFHLRLPRPRPQPQRIRAAGSGGFSAAAAGARRPRGHGAHAGWGQPLRQTRRRAALPTLPGPARFPPAGPPPEAPPGGGGGRGGGGGMARARGAL